MPTDITIKQELTEQQTQKINHIIYYSRVLDHGAACDKPACFEDCRRIKLTLCHARLCIQTQCQTCTNLKKLVRIHSGKCQRSNCPIPNCDHTRVINE